MSRYSGYYGAPTGYVGGLTPGYAGVGQSSNCICSLPTLVILILIILQFSRCNTGYSHNYDAE